jgi:hypothetical protein
VIVLKLGVQRGDALGEPDGLGPRSRQSQLFVAGAPVRDLGDLGIGEGLADVDS